MFDWFWKNSKVETLVNDLRVAQAVITKLTGGLLTLQSEVSLLRQILTANGIIVPIGAKPITKEDFNGV